MARGRDLKISILSDMDKFETKKAADQLEDLGDSARRLDDDIDQTARKVDDSFERIARSSRSNLRKVDDDARAAGAGMDDFKSEVNSTGREAAASFSGSMDDISDSVQEVAANALASFGTVGGLAGLAAAAGIGALVSSLSTAAEEANEAKEATGDLAQEVIDAGGQIKDLDLAGDVQAWSTAIADNKSWWEVWQESATNNLEKVQEAAGAAGEDWATIMALMSGGDIQAAITYMDELRARTDELNESAEYGLGAMSAGVGTRRKDTDAIRDQINANETLIETLDTHVTKLEEAQAIADAWAKVNGYTADQYTLAADTLAGFDEDIDAHALAVEEAARREAEAAGYARGGWEEYAEGVEVSFTDALAGIEEQNQRLAEQNANALEVQRTFGEEGLGALNWFAEQTNRSVADTYAWFTDEATPAEQAELLASWREWGTLTGDDAGTNLATALGSQKGKVAGQAAIIQAAAGEELGRPITIPVDIGTPTGAAYARQQAARMLGRLTLPVVVSPVSGAGARNRIG